MGKRSRAFVNDNYNQVLIEDKENIKEFAMDKDEVGKFSCRVSLKKMNNQDNCLNVSKTLRSAPTKTNSLISNSTLNVKHELKKQDSSEIKDKYKFHDPRITKEAIVLLKRHDNIKKETTMSNDNSNVLQEDIGKDKHVICKSVNNTPECECHSSLLLKDVFIVLERLEDVQEKSTSSNVMLEDDGKAKKVPNKSGKGTKRKKEEKSKEENGDGSKSTKSKKQKESGDSKNSKKEKIPDVSAIDFSNDSKSSSGNPWNFKISSWNVNGIRAWLEKNGISYLHHEQPDILCIQETKCSDDKLPEEVKKIEGYHAYWLAGDKDGYSGVGLLTKEKPLKVEYGIGISEHDNEGRVITAEYDKFYLVSTYVPNAGRGLVRLDYRMKWDKDFREYLKKLDAEKPVILTGDLNVAHEEIDLANPKTNKKNAGFTKEEREGFSALLKEGFIDTFRHLYPDVKGAYTFWTYMMNARAKNVGWRLDYFVISERFTENLCDNVIRKDVFGSDHCPVTLFLSL